jgi:regulator of protease activity HflC (stomatin/prohibitin superfamily)
MKEKFEPIELVCIAGFLLFAVVSIVLMSMNIRIFADDKNNGGVLLGVITLGVEMAYLIFAFGTIGADEVGAKFCFGAPAGNLAPGLYVAFPGIMTVERFPGTQFQDELPGEPSQIFRKDDKEVVPPGMFPPIRVKFGMPQKDDSPELKADPYNVPMTAEVVPVVSWKVTDATSFFKNYHDIDAFRRILEDKSVEVFGNEFSGVTPAKALLTLSLTSEKLEEKIRNETAGTGVEIMDAYVKPFIFSHELNTSVVKVSIARQDADAVRIKAAGDRDKLKEEGVGNAEARKLMLEAEAIGVAKLAEISKTPEGQMTLWMETMAKAFTKAQYSIVPGSELFTAFAGISEAMKKIKPGGKSDA